MSNIDPLDPRHRRQSPELNRTYRYQWEAFSNWCIGFGHLSLPARPADVREYLVFRHAQGARASTLKVAAAAIADMHARTVLPNPCADDDVREFLRTLPVDTEPSPARSLPLDMAGYLSIRRTAHTPRISRGGRPERVNSARRRGATDVAMIGMMRDAMLRVSEAAEVRWMDLELFDDGSGRLRISTKDRAAYRVVSADTVSLLRRILDTDVAYERILGLMPNQISTRIGAAARSAGLGDGYSGESPRLGMIQDLNTLGIKLLGEHALWMADEPSDTSICDTQPMQ